MIGSRIQKVRLAAGPPLRDLVDQCDPMIPASAVAGLLSLKGDIVRVSVISGILQIYAITDKVRGTEFTMDTLPLHSPTQLAAHLKSLRKTRGLTQAQLAKRLGIRQSRLADIENHPETVASAQLLDLLAALGVEVLLRLKPTGERSAHRPRGEW
jgi:HTH-type transcriptional regulator / antitoxin HipB